MANKKNIKNRISIKEKKSSLVHRSSKRDTGESGSDYGKQIFSVLGNKNMQQLLNSGAIQAKLNMSSPNDFSEQEADRVADQIVTSGSSQAKLAPQDLKIQRKGGSSKSKLSSTTSNKIKDLAGKGKPLSQSMKNYFEPRFGADLSNVRVHNDNNSAKLASSINAKAFTHGNDIVFNKGQYKPDSISGKKLMAHELTHVMQQGDFVQREELTIGDGENIPVDFERYDRQSIKDITLDSMNTLEAILNNYQGALNIFKTVVNSDSKEEAALKSSGIIALEEATKFAVSKVIDLASAAVPGGAYAKNIYDLCSNIGKAIEAEKKRSATATTSNQLGHFITNIQAKITSASSQIMSVKQDEACRIADNYNKMSESNQHIYKMTAFMKNCEITHLLKTKYTVEGIFTKISESWINNTKAPGKQHASRIVVNIDKNWKVFDSHIDAPHGSRIAEYLLQYANQSVDLNNLNVPRYVVWFPVYDSTNKDASLYLSDPRCETLFSASGSSGSTSANMLGGSYLSSFRALLGHYGIPKTDNLKGHKSS